MDILLPSRLDRFSYTGRNGSWAMSDVQRLGREGCPLYPRRSAPTNLIDHLRCHNLVTFNIQDDRGHETTDEFY